MIITIQLKDCEFLGDSLYKLPFSVDGYDLLYEGYSPETDFFWGYSVGYIYNQTYKPILFLHTSNKQEQVIFDSDKISKDNKWS